MRPGGAGRVQERASSRLVMAAVMAILSCLVPSGVLARQVLVDGSSPMTQRSAVDAAGSGRAAGVSRFFNEAPTDFDHWTRPTTGDCTRFYTRYTRMRVYPSWSDECVVAGYAGALGYQDVQAVYKNADGSPEFPRWVLRDPAGRYLFVPWGCTDTCPQYAADIGDQGFRDRYIETAREWMVKGYRGIFVDDVNWNLNVSDGSGRLVTPIDPRTGAPMTLPDWKRYMADFVEQIAVAFPDRKIMINSVWWRPESSLDDPTVLRGVRAATHYEIERGTADVFAGQSWRGLLDHIEQVHSLGLGVNLDDYVATSRRRAQFEMATYFLISTGRDLYSAEYRSCPDDAPPSPCSEPWWPAYGIELGRPAGDYTIDGGIYRRSFRDGLVVVNPPGAPRRDVDLGGRYVDLHGNTRTGVSLRGGEARVLRTDR